MTILHSSKITTGIAPSVFTDRFIVRIIYPNPAKDRLQVEFHEDHIIHPDDRVRILDLNGKVMEEMVPSGMETIVFDLQDYAAGMYFFQYNGKAHSESRRFWVR